ncbi:hypothetical protein PMAYCL1PPCAC_23816 [Pristionchus mayeri]|uniref:Uncharacterized protein n=1 Tax=Pristionchus mayeri TaxID=1317129 RepID=A0AAN5CZK0_9BILA|nr:hypothetical protein PMAYCL1PPCAC_23816 [Pristionchus mayeri]
MERLKEAEERSVHPTSNGASSTSHSEQNQSEGEGSTVTNTKSIGMSHPLHLDFICPSCKPPFNTTVRQKIMSARLKLSKKSANGFDTLVQRTQVGLVPYTEEEIKIGYRKLCSHRIVALTQAPMDIKYEGEVHNHPESITVGKIIRSILAEALRKAKREVAVIPSEMNETASKYDVDLHLLESTLSEEVNKIRSLIPSRALIVVPRKLDSHDWLYAKSIMESLLCSNWELYVDQAPPSLSTSKSKYFDINETLIKFETEVQEMGQDLSHRLHVALHETKLHKGFWPLSLAGAHDASALFEWFGATLKPEDEEEMDEEGEVEETREDIQYKHHPAAHSHKSYLQQKNSHSHPHKYSYFPSRNSSQSHFHNNLSQRGGISKNRVFIRGGKGNNSRSYNKFPSKSYHHNKF